MLYYSVCAAQSKMQQAAPGPQRSKPDAVHIPPDQSWAQSVKIQAVQITS